MAKPNAMQAQELETYRLAASQLLRALRGKRSQIAFSRRLGYRANPITDWENSRRSPTITETLRAAVKVRLDPREAFATFLPTRAQADCLDFTTTEDVSAWLRGLRGSTKMAVLTARTGRSRYSIGRWLSGETEPRLPEFLLLVDALTGRVQDWVGALVSIREVPVLAERAEKVDAARRLALEKPDTALFLRIVETEKSARASVVVDKAAHILNHPREEVMNWLEELKRVGVLEERNHCLSVVSELTVSTAGTPEQRHQLRMHWAEKAGRRLRENSDSDWFAYNVIALSRKDSEKVEERLRAAYREVRTIVAESKPEEVAALLTMHLVRFEDPKLKSDSSRTHIRVAQERTVE